MIVAPDSVRGARTESMIESRDRLVVPEDGDPIAAFAHRSGQSDFVTSPIEDRDPAANRVVTSRDRIGKFAKEAGLRSCGFDQNSASGEQSDGHFMKSAARDIA